MPETSDSITVPQRPGLTAAVCIIHLIRNTFRVTSKRDLDAIKRGIRPIYTAVNATAATAALDELEADWGQRYPAVIRLWRNAWAGSSGALLRRSPLRTGRASRPRIRLRQAQLGRRFLRRGVVRARCAARLCGRSGCARGVRRWDRPALRGAGQR